MKTSTRKPKKEELRGVWIQKTEKDALIVMSEPFLPPHRRTAGGCAHIILMAALANLPAFLQIIQDNVRYMESEDFEYHEDFWRGKIAAQFESMKKGRSPL